MALGRRWINGSFQIRPVKAMVVTADGVAQGDGSADRDGGSDDRTPVQQVRGSLQNIIAAGGTGNQKCKIGFGTGYLWRRKNDERLDRYTEHRTIAIGPAGL